MSMKDIKILKSGEYKCTLCNVKFQQRDLAVRHLKTTKHLENQEADSQSKMRILEQQNKSLDNEMLASKLDLILHKLDLMSERTTRLEMRMESMEDQFQQLIVKPKQQQMKMTKSIEEDPVLKQHLDEVKQIEIAERLIKQKVESL